MKQKSAWLMRATTPGGAAAAALSLAPCGASANDYPSQDIRFVCAFPAAAAPTCIVRYFAEKMRPIVKRNGDRGEKPAPAATSRHNKWFYRSPSATRLHFMPAIPWRSNMHLIKEAPFDVRSRPFRLVATINKQAFMWRSNAKCAHGRTWPKLTAVPKQKGRQGHLAVSANSGVAMGGAIYKERAANLEAVMVHYRFGGGCAQRHCERQSRLRSGRPGFALSQHREGRPTGPRRRLGSSAESRIGAADDDRAPASPWILFGRVRRHGAERNAETHRRSIEIFFMKFQQGSWPRRRHRHSRKNYGGDPQIATPQEAQAAPAAPYRAGRVHPNRQAGAAMMRMRMRALWPAVRGAVRALSSGSGRPCRPSRCAPLRAEAFAEVPPLEIKDVVILLSPSLRSGARTDRRKQGRTESPGACGSEARRWTERNKLRSAARLHELEAPFAPFANNSAHPRELIGNADFKEAARAARGSRAVPLETVMQYAQGRTGRSPARRFAALARRDDRGQAVDHVLAHFDRRRALGDVFRARIFPAA